MSVFITGGYRHIGSWTAYFLAKAGQDVIVYELNPQRSDYKVQDHTLI